MVLNTVASAVQTASEVTSSEPAMGTVVAMGVGIVFVGLVILVFITWFMGLFFKGKKAKTAKTAAPAAAAPVAEVIPNKQEIIAAVSAAVAEELGRDVSQIKILSFKKM